MVQRPLFVVCVMATIFGVAACNDSSGGSTASTGGTNAAAGAGAGGGSSASGGSTAASSTPGGASGVCKSEKDIAASASGVAACKAFCAAEDHCKSDTTAAACEEYRRCSIQDDGPPACGPASRAWWDCMRAQSDICNVGACCDAQAAAVAVACAE